MGIGDPSAIGVINMRVLMEALLLYNGALRCSAVLVGERVNVLLGSKALLSFLES